MASELRALGNAAVQMGLLVFVLQHVVLSCRTRPPRSHLPLSMAHSILYVLRLLPYLAVCWILGRKGDDYGRQDRLWPEILRNIIAYGFRILDKRSSQFVLGVMRDVPKYMFGLRRYCKALSCHGVPCTFFSLDEAHNPQDVNLVLYFHGGAYCIGNAEMYLPQFYKLCLEMRKHRPDVPFGILSVEYSLAPEYKFPVALNQALEVYKWALFHCSRSIVLAGDSAGGGLSVAVLLRAQEESLRPADGLILISPWVDPSGESLPSAHLESTKYADFLRKQELAEMSRSYVYGSCGREEEGEEKNCEQTKGPETYEGEVGENKYSRSDDHQNSSSSTSSSNGINSSSSSSSSSRFSVSHPLVSVMRANTQQLSRLPKTLVFSGGREILSPQIKMFVKRLKPDMCTHVEDTRAMHIWASGWPLLAKEGAEGAAKMRNFISGLV